MTASELMSRLNEAANKIARGSVRGSANYMIVSPTLSTYIDTINSKASNRKEKIDRILNG